MSCGTFVQTALRLNSSHCVHCECNGSIRDDGDYTVNWRGGSVSELEAVFAPVEVQSASMSMLSLNIQLTWPRMVCGECIDVTRRRFVWETGITRKHRSGA